MALPVYAQQKDARGMEATQTVEPCETSKVESLLLPSSAGNLTATRPTGWAIGGAPRSTPFAPAASSSGSDSPGRFTPRVEIFGGYNFINVHAGAPFSNFNTQGGVAAVEYNVNRYLGLTGEFTGSSFTRTVGGTNPSGSFLTYLFGPQLNLRKPEHFVPFAHVLFGGAHAASGFAGQPTGTGSFAMAAGGGVDYVFTQQIAMRIVQTDYLMTGFTGPGLAGGGRQNNFRLSTGLVVRLGGAKPLPPPPPPNHPPVISISPERSPIVMGEHDKITAVASDPDNDPLTYTWKASGGKIAGTGPVVDFDSTGLAPGTYTITSRVEDGRGGSAEATTSVVVQPPPNHPPVMTSCSPERSPILVGERDKITAVASDPDNDPLAYTWKSSGGQVNGTDSTAEFDSTGVAPGSYTITCHVEDGRGGSADRTATVDVQAPPPPPQASKVSECDYRAAGSARTDNECKRILDDVALRLKNEPKATIVIVGFADPKELHAAKLAEQRAELAKKFLGEKEIEAARISTRAGTGQAGAEKENRRIDVIWVPEGATY